MGDELPRLPPIDEVIKALETPKELKETGQKGGRPGEKAHYYSLECPILQRSHAGKGSITVLPYGVACENYQENSDKRCKITNQPCPYTSLHIYLQ